MEKADLVKGCFVSLVKSIEARTWYDVRFTVMDDHSSEDTVEFLKSVGSRVPNFEFIQLEKMGYNNSNHEQSLSPKMRSCCILLMPQSAMILPPLPVG
jgi:hypothetical protein